METNTQSIADRAKAIYSRELQSQLEASQPNDYVAIEPDSGDHFLAASFGSAVRAARTAYPDRIAFVIRIGHATALHLGGLRLQETEWVGSTARLNAKSRCR